MKTIIEDANFKAVLEQFRGSYAQIWIFSPSLKRLVIRLTKKGFKDALYILGASCVHINGPFSWKNAHLTIYEAESAFPGELITKVVDEKNGFELVTESGVVLSTGLEIDPWLSFDDPI
ncbi:hypothetical protein SAMN05444266_10582 [Chitinophaga jiangningensis]|uniref:Uncharacterized protein n=1 Tax=Chitinophaga jiangningensis TaxID=1419482 RepID=A0A1M7DPP6_9BACT|nr:hypothetical protein [Chitinophaga jiangningensis]SHL81452.1 hypothetical protein SAMN05444266_10582 [Chitinophaga jiangningensis]